MGEKPAEQIFWSAVGAYRWGRVGDSLKLFEMDERENLASSSQIGKVAKSPRDRCVPQKFASPKVVFIEAYTLLIL